ncbi:MULTISPECIES: protein kinase [Selenomonas]|uniref:Protein kinase n=1 Tax=Selenomonas ruminis TaxID=2593411 RepID=A0A5D6VXU9_9FIRM|nr:MULTISPECIES: protein kinase [Selenomonas]TYZ20092.1 protein kinase [Selenomonas sp. mPRGC5]
MARKANYEEKIATIEAKIEKKKEEIKSLKDELAALQSKKAQNDYQELLDYMKNNNLSAGDVLSKIR